MITKEKLTEILKVGVSTGADFAEIFIESTIDNTMRGMSEKLKQQQHQKPMAPAFAYFKVLMKCMVILWCQFRVFKTTSNWLVSIIWRQAWFSITTRWRKTIPSKNRKKNGRCSSWGTCWNSKKSFQKN